MADEARIITSLNIRKNNLHHQTQPTSFSADVDGEKGPVPGAITIATAGTNIDFSELTTPGWCWITNLDRTNFVEWGIYDTEAALFFPVGELGPGEQALFKFSRNLQEEYTNTGTGTSGPTNRFRMKANTAACVVRVEAFEA
jgi:hypothetical protein